MQIRYSGYVLSGNSELQSLTLGGVGSGTIIDHIQSHNSSDDGFEIFGGRVQPAATSCSPAPTTTTSTPTPAGRARSQYVIAVQKTSGNPDSIIELDSGQCDPSAQTPRTNLKLANFTFVHRNAASGNGARCCCAAAPMRRW